MYNHINSVKDEINHLFNLECLKPKDFARREVLIDELFNTYNNLMDTAAALINDIHGFRHKQILDFKKHRRMLERFKIFSCGELPHPTNNIIYEDLPFHPSDVTAPVTPVSDIDSIQNSEKFIILNDPYPLSGGPGGNVHTLSNESQIKCILPAAEPISVCNNSAIINAISVPTWDEMFKLINDQPHYSPLFYVTSARHFAFIFNGQLFHGNIGRIFDFNEGPAAVKPFKFKDCKFGSSCAKNNCLYYHDPIYCGGSDIRNYLNNMSKIISTWPAIRGLSSMLATAPPLQEEIEYFRSHIFHLLLSYFLLPKAAE